MYSMLFKSITMYFCQLILLKYLKVSALIYRIELLLFLWGGGGGVAVHTKMNLPAF